ncbi:MAG: T9SS type A sorting domain-containing protein [Bacteroidetes bacterium]|nr:T9SS type A sorting domain-containing protein [Bacteroidota bacterium]
MKKILLGLSLILISIFSQAQNGLEQIIVEKYYVANAADSAWYMDNVGGILPVGSITYRLYADMRPGYNLQMVSGNANHNLKFHTSTTFFNDENYGSTTPNFTFINAKKGTTMIDSWITIGGAITGGSSNKKIGVLKTTDTDGAVANTNSILQNNDPKAGIAINEADGLMAGSIPSITMVGFGTGSADANSLNNALNTSGFNDFTVNASAWSVLGGAQGLDTNNRVLIGQFTTDGIFHYELNVQIGTPTGGVEVYVSINPLTPNGNGQNEITIPSLTGTYNVAPSVSITSPANNTYSFNGISIPITASASDLDGSVKKVEFFVDGTSVGIDSVAPYTVNYTSVIGTHAITAKATDNDGYVTTSTIVTLNVVPQNSTWTGAVSNVWTNAANWDYLPASISNVIIPVVTTNYPTVNTATTINNLTLESNATGTASLLDNSLLTVNGTANVKLYVTGNKWHMLSIPVQSATSGVFHLGSGQADIYVKGFTAGNWTSLITNTTTPLVPTKGYAIWADTQTGSTPNPTISFTGTINTGNQPIATETAWTLIGNPYTSSLDWSTIGLSNVEGQAVRVWNHALQLYSTYSVIGGSVNGGSQYLSPMQAFFVKGLNTNGINLTNANRVHNNQGFQKSTNTINNLVKIKAQRGTYTDEINVVYNTIATNNFDELYDASKLFVTDNNIPQIYTLADNNDLSINIFGTLPAAIPINIKLGVADNVSLTASEFNNFDSNVSIKLEDVLTGNIQDLRQNPVYSFAASANENANRFVLHFGMSSNSINETSNNNTNIYAYGKTIYVNTTESVKEISVYNMLGQQITSKVGNNKEINSIAINKASAYYMVRVITDKATYCEKVFIK